jgi:hypothetical protein
MNERLQFVARRLDGEPMADLCREFGISRKTGCKIFDRFADTELHFLRSRLHEISKTCDRESTWLRTGECEVSWKPLWAWRSSGLCR